MVKTKLFVREEDLFSVLLLPEHPCFINLGFTNPTANIY